MKILTEKMKSSECSRLNLRYFSNFINIFRYFENFTELSLILTGEFMKDGNFKFTFFLSLRV